MISIINYLYETITHSGYTKMNARRGHGKLIGVVTGGAMGPYIGDYVAQHAAPRGYSSTKIDEKSKLDRVGAMSNETFNAKRVSIGAGLGALVGAGLGAAHGYMGGEIGTGFGAAVGAGIGTIAGGGIGGMKGSHNAAKRLGYGGFGRVAAATFPGPLVGLTTPKRIQDSKK